MGDLLGVLRRRVDANARHAVGLYLREVPDYRLMSGQLAGAAMLDFSMFIRRSTLENAAKDLPLSEEDMAAIRAAGRQRGEGRLSMESQRQVLGLHTALMLREIYEAATPTDTEDLLHLVGWLGHQGLRARGAYLDGYLTGLGNSWSVPAQVGLFANMLLSDEPIATGFSDQVQMRVAGHYLVAVVCVPPPRLPDQLREHIVETLLGGWRIPMVWIGSGELVIMAPVPGAGWGVSEEVRDRTLALVRAAVAEVGRPCSVGAATGLTGALAESLELARQISQATPPEHVPHDLSTIADRFVELSVAQAPQFDGWLREVVDLLETGPDLILTLDAYYRNDMSRAATAAALRIHTRTLDYRLQRVRELTGLRPSSTRGVRVLTTAVTRALADRWR